MNEEWRKSGGKETRRGAEAKEQVCVRSGTRCGMRFFIRTHLCEQVGKEEDKIKDAAHYKSPCIHQQCTIASFYPEEEFTIKSLFCSLFSNHNSGKLQLDEKKIFVTFCL